jgi:cell division protease FtsH
MHHSTDTKQTNDRPGPENANGLGGAGQNSPARRRPRGPNQPGPNAQQRQSRPPFGWIFFIVLILMTALLVQALTNRRTEVNWNQFVNAYNEGSLENISIQDTAIVATRTAGQDDEHNRQIEFTFNPAGREFWVEKVDTLTQGEFEDKPPNIWLQLLLGPLSLLLMVALLIFVFYFIITRVARGAGGGPGGMLGNFGKSKHRVMARESTGVTFADVAGIDDAKEEVTELVEFLKNPKRFMRLGGRIPRGVLLVGQPGCGKTMLAKAIAGEADVPFLSISGSDFVEMFVGVGASRVRDLFKQAKDSSPCIIFLDEIDAVGRKRGGGFSSGGHDEREQTLNAILVEMDGFESSDQVIVIAATNRADVLDPALTRPGRFDRQVQVPLPDVKGRLEILRVHAKKVKLGPDVSLETIARGTPMFSGAELAAIINESAIVATMADKDFIEHTDLEEARDKVRYGRSRKSRRIEEKERIATAYHEAGHAVLQLLLPDADPLHKVTIIPRGQSLGSTMSLPEKDRYGYGARWLLATQRVLCGGRIAEKRKTDDVSSGAGMDIQMVTQLARAMVLEWGMSEKLGFVRYAPVDDRESYVPEKDYSDSTAKLIDEEVRRFADEAYRDAERTLESNWDKVAAVAEALLKHETLTADEVSKLMQGQTIDKPTVSDLLAAEAAKSRGNRTSEDGTKQPETNDGDELGPGVVPNPA